MLTRRLTLPAQAPSAVCAGTGYVECHRLAFDKVSRDGSGKADIEATGTTTDRVYGVLFRVAAAEESALDRAEGLGRGYRKGNIQVVTPAGAVPATTYIATDKEPAYLPYHWYKAIVVAGAIEHGLPNAYIEWLRTVGSQPDPNATRRAENQGVEPAPFSHLPG